MVSAQVAYVVCMQCGTVIRTFAVSGGMVSHGLCHDCARELERRLRLDSERRAVVAGRRF